MNAKARRSEEEKMQVLEKYDDLPGELNSLSKQVVDSIFKVHQTLGPGYVEKIYEDCLHIEFEDRQISVQRQFPVKFTYNGRKIQSEFRLDIVVENKIIIELKAVDKIHPVHEAQMYSYLKMTSLPMGFLVNFNVPLIKQSLKRYVSKTVYFKVDKMEPVVDFWSKFLALELNKKSENWSEFHFGNIRLGFLLNNFGDQYAGSRSVFMFEFAEHEFHGFFTRAKENGAKVLADNLENPDLRSVSMLDPFGNEFELGIEGTHH